MIRLTKNPNHRIVHYRYFKYGRAPIRLEAKPTAKASFFQLARTTRHPKILPVSTTRYTTTPASIPIKFPRYHPRRELLRHLYSLQLRACEDPAARYCTPITLGCSDSIPSYRRLIVPQKTYQKRIRAETMLSYHLHHLQHRL